MKWLKPLIVVAGATLLYFIVGALIRLPAFLGFTFRFQYAVLALVAVVYGPVMGSVVALAGEALLALQGGGFWWSVIAGAVFLAFIIGFFCNRRYQRAGGFYGGVLAGYIFACLVGNVVAWVVVCPALDMLLYREALDNLLPRGIKAAVAAALVCLLLGSLLLAIFSGFLPWQRPGRLTGEDPAD